MAKVTFQTDLCKGCGLCVGAYSPAVMTDMEKCSGCAFCATMCPDCVITVEK